MVTLSGEGPTLMARGNPRPPNVGEVIVDCIKMMLVFPESICIHNSLLLGISADAKADTLGKQKSSEHNIIFLD